MPDKKSPGEIEEHLLTFAAKKPSPNRGGVIEPTLVVIHYTGDNSLSGALSWLTSKSSKVSAHLVIGKLGEIYQLIPFNLKAWHAGVSSYDGRSGVNGFSIGIECVGVGDNWPETQVAALERCLDVIMSVYDIADIVGHEHVAPKRKVDPGPNFPWDRINERYWII